MYISQEQLSGQSVAFSAKALMLGPQYASQLKSSGREQGARSRQYCSRHGAEGPKWGGLQAGEGRAPFRQASASRGLSSSPDNSISVQTCSDTAISKGNKQFQKPPGAPYIHRATVPFFCSSHSGTLLFVPGVSSFSPRLLSQSPFS